MDKKQFLEAVQKVKTFPKRKFKQTYDFIINLRGLNLKKPEEHVEVFVQLPHEKGKKVNIGALVGPELVEHAQGACDTVVLHRDFAKYADKKEVKKLAKQCDYFIAQANIMPDVAKNFGRVFGPRGKMPNPKAGCVVPPNANLGALADKLRKTIKAVAKIQPSVKVMVGTEDMIDEQVADNMHAVYTAVIGKLPQEANNVKSVLLKFTMGPPVIITDKGVEVKVKQGKKPGVAKTPTEKKTQKKKSEEKKATEEKKEETPAEKTPTEYTPEKPAEEPAETPEATE